MTSGRAWPPVDRLSVRSFCPLRESPGLCALPTCWLALRPTAWRRPFHPIVRHLSLRLHPHAPGPGRRAWRIGSLIALPGDGHHAILANASQQVGKAPKTGDSWASPNSRADQSGPPGRPKLGFHARDVGIPPVENVTLRLPPRPAHDGHKRFAPDLPESVWGATHPVSIGKPLGRRPTRPHCVNPQACVPCQEPINPGHPAGPHPTHEWQLQNPFATRDHSWELPPADP